MSDCEFSLYDPDGLEPNLNVITFELSDHNTVFDLLRTHQDLNAKTEKYNLM